MPPTTQELNEIGRDAMESRSSRRIRRAWIAIAVFIGISLIDISVRPWIATDFDEYHRAGARVARGETPYQLDELGYWHAYRYPPGFAFAMIPVAELDVAWAGRLWFAANWCLLAGCVGLSLYLVLGPRPWPAGVAAIALAALMACCFYNFSNLYQGQVGIAMTCACLGWAACRRSNRNFTGGLLLAGACALKLAPAVLVPYLVLRKDWRGLAGVILGGLVFVLMPVPWVGIEGTIELHREWLHFLRETQAPILTVRPGNQGLLAMLARTPLVSNGGICYSLENLKALERYYPLAVIGLAAVLYGYIGWSGRGRTPGASLERDRTRENLDLILLFLFMTIANPCAWRCNFPPLLLPAFALAHHAYHNRPGARLCRTALWLLALTWTWSAPMVLINLVRRWLNPMEGISLFDVLTGNVPNEHWSFQVWVLQGAHFWTALFVGFACWRIMEPGSSSHPVPENIGRRKSFIRFLIRQ